MARAFLLTAVEERGMCARGLPRNPGDLSSPRRKTRRGPPGEQRPGPRKAGLALAWERQTAQEYAEHLEENLRDLLNRAKSGTYWAPPVRRVHIPKGDGRRTRPIGIPTFEDQVLQRAVTRVLDAVYEQDFRDGSYGFRPGRSAHQALDVLWKRLMAVGGGFVLELDIEDFFGSLDHQRLREILRKRVRDGVLLRLIGKWLHAGVLEEGSLTHPEAGTPQGGVISPLLANVFLHEVLDAWLEDVVRPRMRGPTHLVRYADDVVIVFAREEDARRVMAVLSKRLAKYGLRLHPEKTRLVAFGRSRSGGREGRPGTFDFLGFTHYWGKSRRGNLVVRCKTARDRFIRSLRAVSHWCRVNRHAPVAEQQRVLGQKLRGHYAYYGSPGTGSVWRVSGGKSGVCGASGSLAARARRGCHGSASLASCSDIRFHDLASCSRFFVSQRVLDLEEPDALIGHVRI